MLILPLQILVIMSSFFNRLVVFICKSIALLPFWFLYLLSDLCYFILYYVVGYRKKVVRENLTRSFPEKSADEIRRITRKFYHHLGDIGVETIKYSRMTEEEVDARVKINGLELYDEYYNKGRSIILLGMHYNNWEWIGGMHRFLKAQFFYVYNPMRSNKEFEKFLLSSRVKFGGKSVPIEHSVRVALNFSNSEKPQGLMLVADQTAPGNSQFWTTFLNQETAFFSGPMKIAVKTNQPVILYHMRKVKRGHYEVFHYKLVENPAEVEPEEILMAYIRKMEEIIREEPEYWLWSHRRWKHKRPANIPLR